VRGPYVLQNHAKPRLTRASHCTLESTTRGWKIAYVLQASHPKSSRAFQLLAQLDKDLNLPFKSLALKIGGRREFLHNSQQPLLTCHVTFSSRAAIWSHNLKQYFEEKELRKCTAARLEVAATATCHVTFSSALNSVLRAHEPQFGATIIIILTLNITKISSIKLCCCDLDR
jgi:hypothetical protein